MFGKRAKISEISFPNTVEAVEGYLVSLSYKVGVGCDITLGLGVMLDKHMIGTQLSVCGLEIFTVHLRDLISFMGGEIIRKNVCKDLRESTIWGS